MEQEFKNRMLAYLVGDYQTESPNTNVRIKEYSTITSDIANTIQTLESPMIKGRITDKDNKYIIVYGIYGNGQSYFDNNGFILLADNNLNSLELFTTYEGGTLIPSIEKMEVADDGTFYAITSDSTGKYKLTMLNNFTLTLTGTYSVKYRQSYELDSSLQNMDPDNINMNKKIGSADYIITGVISSSPSTIEEVVVATLQIVVGGENTWTHANYNVNIAYATGANIGKALTTFIGWVNDDFYVKLGGYYNGHYVEYQTINNSTMTTYTSTFDPKLIYVRANGGVVMPTYNTTYVAVLDRVGDKYNIYKVQNNSETLVYTDTIGDTGGYSKYFIINTSGNDIVFSTYCTADYEAKVGYIDLNGNIFIIGSIREIFENSIVYVNTQYNLKTIYIGDLIYDAYKCLLIYNINNYNAQDYQALNSMIPKSSILYDTNNKIIFARNIYNKTVNQNTTESSVEVPNVYLNDTTIGKQNLYSETNSLLNSNTQSITKNIYETLYINFFNTINIKNANDPNNVIINVPGASRLNGSISGYNSYNNVKIGIAKVNYNDGTNQTITGLVITKNSNSSYTIDFTIYVPKPITSIQIMSNDGMTTYQTINPNLQTEKFYRITQDVKIV